MTEKSGYGVMTEICGVCNGKKDKNQIVCDSCHKKQRDIS